MSSDNPRNFQEFWPFYVGEHRDPRNRRLHFVGTGLGLVLAGVAIFRSELGWLLGVPLIGYGCAWYGHFRIERNRPATFRYPIYSFIADYKMFALMLSGRMDRELVRFASLKPGLRSDQDQRPVRD